MKATGQKLELILACFLLTISCGCNAVISKHPVGEKPARIVAKDWEGNWENPDGAVTVKVVDADKGLLKVFWLEDDKQGTPAMKTAEIEVRESGGWLFANTREEGKNRGYHWGRITNEDRQIIVWLPDKNMFAQMVKESVFPGRVDGEDVLLEELTPRHLKIIITAEKGVLLDWDKPVVFVKMRS